MHMALYSILFICCNSVKINIIKIIIVLQNVVVFMFFCYDRLKLEIDWKSRTIFRINRIKIYD